MTGRGKKIPSLGKGYFKTYIDLYSSQDTYSSSAGVHNRLADNRNVRTGSVARGASTESSDVGGSSSLTEVNIGNVVADYNVDNDENADEEDAESGEVVEEVNSAQQRSTSGLYDTRPSNNRLLFVAGNEDIVITEYRYNLVYSRSIFIICSYSFYIMFIACI